MNDRHPHRVTSTGNIIQFPQRQTEEGSDPYSELGGGIPPYRQPESPRFSQRPRGYEQEKTFFDYDRRTPENAWQVEVNKAYDLKLNGELTNDHLQGLLQTDRQILAAAVYDLIETLNHRPTQLLIEGNYNHPLFEHYGLQGDQAAQEYAGLLWSLRDALVEQAVVSQLYAEHAKFADHAKNWRAARRIQQGREVKQVVIDDEGRVRLDRTASPLSVSHLRDAGLRE